MLAARARFMPPGSMTLRSVEHAHHARMVDPRQGFHFLVELLADPGILLGLFEQYLNNDELREKLAVLCQVHRAHSAAAEFPYHFIAVVENQTGLVHRVWR